MSLCLSASACPLLKPDRLSAIKAVPPGSLAPVQLTFHDLISFEPVQDQYQPLGIRFEDAIALYPSNPAFPALENAPVLMPSSQRSGITVYFQSPRQVVEADIAAAHQVRIDAFDRRQRLVAQTQSRSLYSLRSKDAPFPQHRLEVRSAGVTKVVFRSTAPFILNRLFCA